MPWWSLDPTPLGSAGSVRALSRCTVAMPPRIARLLPDLSCFDLISAQIPQPPPFGLYCLAGSSQFAITLQFTALLKQQAVITLFQLGDFIILLGEHAPGVLQALLDL